MPTPITATTQDHLDVEDVINNLILLKDGSAAMVLKISAVNFALLSEEEQDAIIYSYAGLLNSLSFPIQILIRSQKKDITDYVKLLQGQEVKQTNPVLQKRIGLYRQFVEKLVKERNVLDKRFYVVIPFSRLELGLTKSSFNPLAPKVTTLPFDKSYIIQKALNTLEPRRDHLLRQFARLGLTVKQLLTQDLIQLLYVIYNPDAAEGILTVASDEYQSPLVQTNLPPQPQTPNSTQQTPTPPPAPAQA